MFIVQVFRPEIRPEYDGRTEAYEAWEANPFDGIEILGIVETEADVNTLIDRAQRTMEPRPHTWKFHYEELPIPMEYPGGTVAS